MEVSESHLLISRQGFRSGENSLPLSSAIILRAPLGAFFMVAGCWLLVRPVSDNYDSPMPAE